MASAPRLPFVAMSTVPAMASTRPAASRTFGSRRVRRHTYSMMSTSPKRSSTVPVPAFVYEMAVR